MATTNIVCDLETTGKRSGCSILSVGLVFILEGTICDTYYEKISHTESKLAGFSDDPDTLVWWNKQRADIQEEAFSGFRSPGSVLQSISNKMKEYGSSRELHLWGNGSDFDNAILAGAYEHLGLPQPWHYTNNSCYRTWKNSVPVPYQKPIDAHNALADAVAQARHLIQIHEFVSRASGNSIKVLR